MSSVEKWVEIKAPVEHVFQLFSRLSSFPRWMTGVETVRLLAPRHTRWTARDLSGTALEWEAETTAFDPHRRLAWRSRGGPVDVEWDATFEETKRGTTLMCLMVSYGDAETRQSGAAALLLGEDPKSQLGESLARFKQLAEDETRAAAVPEVRPRGDAAGPGAPVGSGLTPAAADRQPAMPGPQPDRPVGRGLWPDHSRTITRAPAALLMRPQKIALAVLLAFLLGAAWYRFYRPRPGAPLSRAADPAAAVTPAMSPEAAHDQAGVPADPGATTAEKVTPEIDAPPPAPPAAAREPSALRESVRVAIDQWIAATNARDVDKLMGFYAPTVQRYYRRAYVSRDVVRADKRRVAGEADAVRVSAGEPQFAFRMEGNVAYARFRKRYEVERRGRVRRGEVWHELALSRQGEGWQIFGERDLRVIR